MEAKFDLQYYKNFMYPVIGALYEVHRELGPGLNEYVYQEGLAMQLAEDCIDFEKEKEFMFGVVSSNAFHSFNTKPSYAVEFVA